MTVSKRFRASTLIALGLIGMAVYPIVVRGAHPSFLNGDAAHGAWFGVCLGLEIVGLWMLRSTRTTRES